MDEDGKIRVKITRFIGGDLRITAGTEGVILTAPFRQIRDDPESKLMVKVRLRDGRIVTLYGDDPWERL